MDGELKAIKQMKQLVTYSSEPVIEKLQLCSYHGTLTIGIFTCCSVSFKNDDFKYHSRQLRCSLNSRWKCRNSDPQRRLYPDKNRFIHRQTGKEVSRTVNIVFQRRNKFWIYQKWSQVCISGGRVYMHLWNIYCAARNITTGSDSMTCVIEFV